MKKTVILLISTLFFVFASCGKEETKLEIFNPDAYAYPMERGWELNGSFRVKGLQPIEEDDFYRYEISYSLSLIDSQNHKRLLFKDALYKERFDEEQIDIGVDFQAELDSTFKEGKYQALIDINDNLSRKYAQLEFDIELSGN